MRTTFKKIISIIALAVFTISIFTVCRKDEEIVVSEEYTYGALSGEWQLDLHPISSYQDTSIIEGMRVSDYNEKESSYDEILLYENKKGNIYGEMMGYKISGIRKVNDIELVFYAYPDGPLNTNIPITQMIPFSKMQLKVNEFGIANGTGNYYADSNHVWTQHDVFEVYGRKIKEITNAHLRQASFKNALCDIASAIASFGIAYLTDGVFRPMSNCYGEKAGGGYYVFGHEGPGSILPVLTTTVYVAWEKSWCKARKYDFEVQLKGENLSYTAMKTALQQLEPEYHLIVKKLNFPNFDEFVALMDDFHQTYGGFAFSLGYNAYTHNMTLFVNTEKGNTLEASNHPLVQAMSDGLDPHCSTLTVKKGKNIHDEFLMERSGFGACNSFIIFYYLFGTNYVIYN